MLRNIGASPLDVFFHFSLSLALFFSRGCISCIGAVRFFFFLVAVLDQVCEIHYLKNPPQCCATLGAPPPMLRNIAGHPPNVVQQNGYVLFFPQCCATLGATPPMLRNIGATSRNVAQHCFQFLDFLVAGCNVLL